MNSTPENNQRPEHEIESERILEIQVAKWRLDPSSVQFLDDDLHKHFRRCAHTSSGDVSDAGLRAYNLVVGPHNSAKSFSPIDWVMSSVAAAGANSMTRSLSRALGISEDTIEDVLADYVEGRETEPMGIVEFAQLLAEAEAEKKAKDKSAESTLRP